MANASLTFSDSISGAADGLDEFFGLAVIDLPSQPLGRKRQPNYYPHKMRTPRTCWLSWGASENPVR